MLRRVLIVHNEYQLPGGEDQVVANELALLRGAGLDASLYRVTNHSITGMGDRVRAALAATYSLPARRRMDRELQRVRPDLVHVHNFFPLLSPSIYDACHDHDIPVVQTLHNYRIICPGALLAREGRVCEDCLGTLPLPAVRHRCYRGSLPGSMALAAMVAVHGARGTWNKKVNRLIALTEFSKSRFVLGGIDPDRIAIKPNFVEDPLRGQWTAEGAPRGTILFVGRLSPEKGLESLIQGWTADLPELRIAGEGPLAGAVRDRQNANLRALGPLSRAEVNAEMAAADYLIIPSEWYEGLPMTFVEAMASGLPVLASRLGSLQELVTPGTNGFLFEAGNPASITATVRAACAPGVDLQALRSAARREYEQRYSPQVNLERLLEIYGEAMGLTSPGHGE